MIRKTIKLITVAWVSALAMGFNSAFGLSLSHETVIPSELVQYVIPRFSLKTRIWFDQVESAGDIQLATKRPETGAEVLKLVSGETVFVTAVDGAVESSDYRTFVDWLVSEPGRATIADFELDGQQIAIPTAADEAAPIEMVIVGNIDHGRELSRATVAVVTKLIVPTSTQALITRLRSMQCDRSMTGISGFRRFTLCRRIRL